MIFWNQTHGSRAPERSKTYYIDVLRRVTVLEEPVDMQLG